MLQTTNNDNDTTPARLTGIETRFLIRLASIPNVLETQHPEVNVAEGSPSPPPLRTPRQHRPSSSLVTPGPARPAPPLPLGKLRSKQR